MDARHFDTLTVALGEAGTRRGMLGLLATLPVVGGLVALFTVDDEADAKGRRKRRKKKHKHGEGRHKKKHRKKKCKAHSTAKTCAGKCGSVKNNCKKSVDCGSCACDPPCDVCFTCQEGPQTHGACVPDPGQVGEACGAPGQVCQSDGSCACSADPATCPSCTTCGGNGACQGCAGCCDGTSCVPDCGDCRVCDDGQCAGCPDCCDANGDCQPGDTEAACGSSGTCDVCDGQEQCQSQQCVCVPDCDGKVCGSDGCTGTCAPGCPPLSTCASDGTSCECVFETCDDTCCADGEDCCGNDCVDVQSDPEHCGNCATACAPGEDCCGGECIDQQSDPTNCGACGTTCGGTQICDGGACHDCDVCPTCAYTTVQAAVADDSGPATIRICAGDYTETIQILRPLSLIGAGQGDSAADTILHGAGDSVVTINAAPVTLQALRITGGTVIQAGGGILIQSVAVTMIDCTVTGNTAREFGAGIYKATGALTMTDCTVSDNIGDPTRCFGGGILNNDGTLTLNDTVVTGNSADIGGGIFHTGDSLTLNAGSRVTGNTATEDGGGIFSNSNTVTLNSGSLVCDNAEPQCSGFTPPSGFCGACP